MNMKNKMHKFVPRNSQINLSAQEDGVKVCVIIQNSAIMTYDNEDHLLYMADEMKQAGVDVVMTEEYGNHYAVIDDQLVWHGGMNLLGKEDAWDNLMRTKDPDAAQELLFMAQKARDASFL